MNHMLITDMNRDRFLVKHKLNPTDYFLAKANAESKLEEAIARIIRSPFALQSMYVGHSGGKDSVLVRFIADQIDPDIPTMHNPKPAGQENAVHPLTQNFLYGLTRPILYAGLDDNSLKNRDGATTQIDGTRIAEHDRDDGRSIDVVIDGKVVSRKELQMYIHNGLFGINFLHPIFDWSNEEVWAAIDYFEIPFSKEYDVDSN